MHLAQPYRLGVDVDQLPQIVEQVVGEYYQKHRAGQTFSSYWREKLRESDASKVGDNDYTPPTWVCERCEYRHLGDDPPVYCPSCAGLRRLFARLEDGGEPASPRASDAAPAQARADGLVDAANEQDLSGDEGLTVETAGNDVRS